MSQTTLGAFVAILDHIKTVQNSVIEISASSSLVFNNALIESNITPTDSMIEAMQYHDIMTQQLVATIEAIEKTVESLSHQVLQDESAVYRYLTSLDVRLSDILAVAQSKQNSFLGRIGHESKIQTDEEIFF